MSCPLREKVNRILAYNSPMNHRDDVTRLLAGLESLVERIESLYPPQPGAPDWRAVRACRWRRRQGRAYFQEVIRPHAIALDDLKGIERQKRRLVQNTLQFVRGVPANNALLWGPRGTGKSSLIKALLNEYGAEGLRVIEVEGHALMDLGDIVEDLYGRPERFVLFSDDLSFEADDPGYKALKAVLDGALTAQPENVLVYATSNRRHLLPEYMAENNEARLRGGEIHHGEAVEEKISLSERFGLWLAFHPFSQAQYLDIVSHWLAVLGVAPAEVDGVHREALQWALLRGSRSGRAAWQFARDYAGRATLAGPVNEVPV